MEYRGTTEYQGKHSWLNQGLDLIIFAITTSSMGAFYGGDKLYLYNCTLENHICCQQILRIRKLYSRIHCDRIHYCHIQLE